MFVRFHEETRGREVFTGTLRRAGDAGRPFGTYPPKRHGPDKQKVCLAGPLPDAPPGIEPRASDQELLIRRAFPHDCHRSEVRDQRREQCLVEATPDRLPASLLARGRRRRRRLLQRPQQAARSADGREHTNEKRADRCERRRVWHATPSLLSASIRLGGSTTDRGIADRIRDNSAGWQFAL